MTLSEVDDLATTLRQNPIELLRSLFHRIESEPSEAAWREFGTLAVAAEDSLAARLADRLGDA